MSEYKITSVGPITVSVPGGARVTIGYNERRSLLPRRMIIRAPIVIGAVYGAHMIGKRKALFDRRTINGVRRSVGRDHRTERRDPDREMYQYKTSQDPRIRAMERRGVNITPMSDVRWSISASAWVPTDRRWMKDRRVAHVDCKHYRRVGQRRKP